MTLTFEILGTVGILKAFKNIANRFSEWGVFWKPVKILLIDYKGNSIGIWASRIWSLKKNFNLCFGA